MQADAAELVAFWFDAATEPAWFGGGPTFDAMLRRRFGHLVAFASRTPLPGPGMTPPEALARCVGLDQLPRNIFRGTPRAFAYDRLARATAVAAVAQGLDRGMTPGQRLFIYLPFEHSEDLADQLRSIELFTALGQPEWLDYAHRHARVIERFGRFPHRNTILHRPSIAAELAFLREPGASF